MFKVLTCLAVEHDFRFILIAAAVCLTSTLTAFWLLGRASRPQGLSRGYWLSLTGAAAGAGVWATHFIAMLAYRPGFPTGYLPLGTAASLVIAVGIAAAGFTLASSTKLSRIARLALGGPILGGGVGAMHYVGMGAFRTIGQVIWDPVYVASSLILGVALATTALFVAKDSSTLRTRIAGAVLLTVGICALHFTAMAAMTIVPDPTVIVPPNLMSNGVMAGVVAVLALALIGAAVWTALIDAGVHRNALATLQVAVDAMPEGMAYFAADGRCLMWNRRYAELAPPDAVKPRGFTLRSLLETGLAQGRYPEAKGREAAWLSERLEAFENPTEAIEHRLADGSWLRVQERRTADGGIVTVCTDVTELKARNQILAKAKADAEAANLAKSEFLANMSHELRTPLNGVVAMSDLLTRRPLADEEREMAEMIRASGSALERLLSDILDLARIESGEMSLEQEPFHLGELVRSVTGLVRLQADEKGLALEVVIDDAADVGVIGDAGRVRQILWNLLSNAVKFTQRGRVLVRARLMAEGLVRLDVEDTGPGFDAALKDRMFRRFEQIDGSIVRSHGGAGLGLAIVRDLTELAGGFVDCESEPGVGSSFWCVLPLEASQEAPSPVVAAGEPQQALRVLLVDDHPANRKIVQLLLSSCAADVVEAENGAVALEAFDNGSFDVVLMDMQMPVMDGLTAVREIRRREQPSRSATPVIMLTANAMPEHVMSAKEAGADLHLSKPITADQLFAAIEEVLTAVDASARSAA